MSWLARLLGPRGAAARRGRPATAAASVQPPAPASSQGRGPAAGDGGASPTRALPDPLEFVAWLLGREAAEMPVAAPAAGGAAAIAELDRVLAQGAIGDELLPRAAAVVPQLIALLRQSELPVAALAERLAKDTVLTAEVMRVASIAYHRGEQPVAGLAMAIQRIGTRGVQAAIARVVMKPLYDTPAGTLGARAAARLWDWSDVLARRMAAAVEAAPAQSTAATVFDGYLAGLLHGTGWAVALRILDRAGIGLEPLPSDVGALALVQRAHALFGLAAGRWDITPAFVAFAADARVRPLAESRDPLAATLLRALPAAWAEVRAGAAAAVPPSAAGGAPAAR